MNEEFHAICTWKKNWGSYRCASLIGVVDCGHIHYILIFLRKSKLHPIEISQCQLLSTWFIHANPRETKSGRGSRVCHEPPPRKLFFRRMQNGAFCCILDIQSVQSNLKYKCSMKKPWKSGHIHSDIDLLMFRNHKFKM
jgi:hypothetical protein